MSEETSHVADELKRLRKQAKISVRRMARLLGFNTAGSYQHYEDRFKKDLFPYDFAKRAAAILGRHGIAPDELRVLFAGYEERTIQFDNLAPGERLVEADQQWIDGYCQGQEEMRVKAARVARQLGELDTANEIRNIVINSLKPLGGAKDTTEKKKGGK